MFNANALVSTTSAANHGLGSDMKVATSTYTVSAALTANQVIPMLAVPAGARIVDARITVSGITGGTFNVGDTATPARFISAGAPGTRLQTNDLHLYKQSTIINVVVGTAPTGTTGTVKLMVEYVISGVSPRDP